MDRRDLAPSQRAIVMAGVPKLQWGGKRYGETEESSLIKSNLNLSQHERAQRAGVSDNLQAQADAIHEFGAQAARHEMRSPDRFVRLSLMFRAGGCL